MFSQQIIFGVYHVSQSARPKAFVKYFYFLIDQDEGFKLQPLQNDLKVILFGIL